MNWLNRIVDALVERHPEGEILIESGVSPSGSYHIGHLREFVTPDAIRTELVRRGRKARHIHFVDDYDAFRKVPANVPEEYSQYLGMPLCNIPAPDGSDRSYAEYFLSDFKEIARILHMEVEFMYASEKYRSGFMTPAIEKTLENIDIARTALVEVSGRKLDDRWTPVQILEDSGRLKSRRFLRLDKEAKLVFYEDVEGNEQSIRYDNGGVKLDWRLDWPGRWWLLGIDCEPFGRDHATKGGSYDTGERIMHDVYQSAAPYPVPYEFINMAGDTKKMSASKGTALSAVEAVKIMPPEVLLYFLFRSPANKQLFFDPEVGFVQLMDDFAALSAKPDKTAEEKQLLDICTHGQHDKRTVSRVPFSHLVASYQASLRDPELTLEVVKRTEHKQNAEEDAAIIKHELAFIDAWLDKRAPESVKFSLRTDVDLQEFNETERSFLAALGEVVAQAPADADGTWFHNAIYEFKDTSGLTPQEMFSALYRAIIGKNRGPRAGWFLSILPRDWLVTRLQSMR